MAAESTRKPGEPIAIVGVGCLFPGCQSPDELWQRIQSGTCAISDVPAGRWLIEPEQAFDPTIALADHVYSTQGGFVTLPPLDLAGLDLDPELLGRLDPLFHLVLHVAAESWRDARTEAVDRDRVGLIFGNIVLPTETASALTRELFGRLFEEELGIPVCQAADIHPLNAFPAGMPAAVAAKALGLGGAAYTLDAACGSSLYALKLAVDELRSGRADAMICGGVSRPDPLYTQMGFSQLRALSTCGRPAPFDARADGLIVGEGAGMFVLKRLRDAQAHGDHIYGIVAGIGLSNDVHGDLLAPSAEGQLRALRQAYEQAGWNPSDVDLIECHATGTPRGDAVELESLRELWRNGPARPTRACVLGSVKSNIGHTLTAAGAAGLLKVLLALRHGVLPASANFQQPNPILELDDSPFRILKTPEPWPIRTPGQPRRAAVSGFGFGGINAHVLIEEWTTASGAGVAASACPRSEDRGHHAERADDSPRAPIAIVGIAAQFGPIGPGRSFQNHVLGGRPQVDPSAPPNWWGIPDTQWFRQAGWDRHWFPGYYLDSLQFRVDQFRIPPRELVEILPQQSLMLDVAAQALRDARWQSRLASRTGVLIGIGLDLNTTNYHWRWSLPDRAQAWSAALGLDGGAEALARWIEELRAISEPALSANRTMGSLGGVVASRIAREFQIGGPSFSISCDENSGIQALAIAVDWLDRNELDAVVVGAVDFAGDIRALVARAELSPDALDGVSRSWEGAASGAGVPARRSPPETQARQEARPPGIVQGHLGATAADGRSRALDTAAPVACDGAVCLILKRLDDARRDGDRIEAVIREAATRREPSAAAPSDNRARRTESLRVQLVDDRPAANSIGYLDIQIPHRSADAPALTNAQTNSAFVSSGAHDGQCALGSIVDDFGHLGAAAGLAAVAKAAVCIGEQIIPSPHSPSQWLRALTESPPGYFVPGGRQFWLRNREEGPRRAAVCVFGIGGNLGEVVLEEFEPSSGAMRPSAQARVPTSTRTSGLFALEADDRAGLAARVEELAGSARETSNPDIDALARRWLQDHPTNPRLQLATTVVADGIETLKQLLEIAAGTTGEERLERDGRRGSIHAARARSGSAGNGSLAFVYPGLGNHFIGMGRELSAIWPDVLRQFDSESDNARDQFDPSAWWSAHGAPPFLDHRIPILGSVWLGSLVSELIGRFGVNPRAAIGYSLGESTALMALRAWTNRDELCWRIRSSSLFRIDLAGPCEAARRCWGLAPAEPVDWVAGIVPCSVEAVEAVISPGNRVYVLIRNSPDETVIGGQRRAVDEVVEALRSSFVDLTHVSTVHCEIGRLVEPEYRELHDLETNAPAGVDFYSGVWGHAYAVDRSSAAEAITAHAAHRIDFPAVIERAYQDGVRLFLEVGPGGSCTRHINRILGNRPHRAFAACRADREPFGAILDVLGILLAERIPVDLARLYATDGDLNGLARFRESEPSREPVSAAGSGGQGRPPHWPRPPRITKPRLAAAGPGVASTSAYRGRGTVCVAVRGRAFSIPQLPKRSRELATAAAMAATDEPEKLMEARVPISADEPAEFPSPVTEHTQIGSAPSVSLPAMPVVRGEGDSWSRHLFQAERATAEAHRAFLRGSQQTADLMGRLISFQFSLLQSRVAPTAKPISSTETPSVESASEPLAESACAPPEPDASGVVLDRKQCLEFAVGSIASILGPDYAAIDQFPTRVRLPDEPLMLVDRILAIEGRPRSLEEGRVVTEHVIDRDAWYLDSGTAPACIAIEAGQADLFLSAYLGADFVTEGRSVYRLLDATVTFHRGLPRPGEVIRYDIQINRFFRQGNTMLFRFQFDATVDREPLLTMRDGCAGFFSAEELAGGKGIVPHKHESHGRTGAPAQAMAELVPGSSTRLDDRQVDALRSGDLTVAFGAPFARLPAKGALHLPEGRLALLHRVPLLDPQGGPHGMGLIRAEADIRPGDWFLVCHFVDDRVMPGTLMYECCLQALRVLLMRRGWVGPRGRVAFEPVAGVANRLRCRGQVVESTRVATYEVAIKELGYRPEPYAVADALIFADGKPIVEVRDMALQLSGTDRHGLEELWAIRSAEDSPARAMPDAESARSASAVSRSPVLFDRDRILEFAVGKPSAAFGDRYRPFDDGRFIARLPAPPFQFIDRITRIDAEPWVMAAGSAATAEFDIVADAWYFGADRQECVPHGVMLETALQACGWLAAYMGSALQSDDDLKFRILGGTGLKHGAVPRKAGTLSTRVKATRISQSGGMILQQYEFSVRSADGVAYEGLADLGFFPPNMLAQPDGIRDDTLEPAGSTEGAGRGSFGFPTEAPFPDSLWRLVEEIDGLCLEGGSHGLGVVRGSTRIDPDSWFFRAHFLGDPVWPGSLGQESVLQLLKVMASARWGSSASTRFESPGLAIAHRWTYRGQITPDNRLMTIRAEIKECNEEERRLVADGYLGVDGRIIHQMRDYSLRLCES
jgi:PfaB family protein